MSVSKHSFATTRGVLPAKQESIRRCFIDLQKFYFKTQSLFRMCSEFDLCFREQSAYEIVPVCCSEEGLLSVVCGDDDHYLCSVIDLTPSSCCYDRAHSLLPVRSSPCAPRVLMLVSYTALLLCSTKTTTSLALSLLCHSLRQWSPTLSHTQECSQ